MKVMHKSFGAAIGQWELVYTATGSFSRQVSVGTTENKTASTSSSTTNSLTTAMNIGLQFNNMSISDAYTNGITTATQETYTKSITDTVTMTCTSADFAENIGVWQWVTATSDGVYEARTS